MERIRIGIAGYGVVGKTRHWALKDNSDFEVLAVCDKNFVDNPIRIPGVASYTNYKELLDSELDAVCVCLSNDMAAEVSLAALRRGLHVFCEKPPARNLAELYPVIEEEAIQKHLKLKYGFNHRYHRSVKEALELVSSGQMGRVINLRGVYGKSNLITFDQTDWRTKRSIAGGGILLDQGIHMVDLLRLFGGSYDQVFSFISNEYWGYDVEDNAYALLKSDVNVIAMLHSSATQWQHKFRLEIGLERGLLTLSGILSGSKSYGRERLRILHAPGVAQPVEYQEEKEYEHDSSWSDEIADFGKDIRLNRRVETGSSTDALETMRLISKIYESDQTIDPR